MSFHNCAKCPLGDGGPVGPTRQHLLAIFSRCCVCFACGVGFRCCKSGMCDPRDRDHSNWGASPGCARPSNRGCVSILLACFSEAGYVQTRAHSLQAQRAASWGIGAYALKRTPPFSTTHQHCMGGAARPSQPRCTIGKRWHKDIAVQLECSRDPTTPSGTSLLPACTSLDCRGSGGMALARHGAVLTTRPWPAHL